MKQNVLTCAECRKICGTYGGPSPYMPGLVVCEICHTAEATVRPEKLTELAGKIPFRLFCKLARTLETKEV